MTIQDNGGDIEREKPAFLFFFGWLAVLCFTKVGVIPGQPVEGGVEGSDEEVMPQLHDGQPQQVPQEEPGQNTALETHR